MPRYIDADALIDDIRKHSESYFADDFAHEWVDKQPSADVQPVRRGHWVDWWASEQKTCPLVYCNVCKWQEGTRAKKYLYCPNCGARMDGEQNDMD